MKKRYTWKEFENAALSFLELNIEEVKPHYIKIYGYEPEGGHYDFPDFVEIDFDRKPKDEPIADKQKEI